MFVNDTISELAGTSLSTLLFDLKELCGQTLHVSTYLAIHCQSIPFILRSWYSIPLIMIQVSFVYGEFFSWSALSTPQHDSVQNTQVQAFLCTFSLSLLNASSQVPWDELQDGFMTYLSWETVYSYRLTWWQWLWNGRTVIPSTFWILSHLMLQICISSEVCKAQS